MKIAIVNGRGASGKALPNSTLIPTPNGYKKVEEIKIGDFLFDRKGNPTKVLGVFPQGEKEIYKVYFKNGKVAECSEDHLWNIHKQSWHKEKSKNKFKPYSLKQIIEEGVKISDRAGYRFKIQNNEAVKYPRQNLNVHPYVFGAFLGDGCCLERQLTLSSNDIEIVEKINTLLNAGGYTKKSELNYNWYFLNKEKKKNKSNVDVKYIQTLDLFKDYSDNICQLSYNKSIPDIYKYSSIEQRLELLQGLMDTDGSIDKNGSVKFTSTSKTLIYDVKEIIESLGYWAIIHKDERKNKYTNEICYQLCIQMNNKDKEKIFSLSRKKDIAKTLPDSLFDYNTTQIIKIERTDRKEEMTCFLVDNEEHLFLMNNYIVTHNTTFETMVQKIAAARGKKVKVTSTIDYVKEVAELLGWDGKKTPEDRRFLSDLKDALTRWKDLPYQKVKSFIEIYEQSDTDLLFIDCREPEEIARFVNDYGALTILVQRGEFELLGNHADDNVMNYQYDVVIDNNRGLDELMQEATIFEETFVEEEE